jgi:hypothetical protein
MADNQEILTKAQTAIREDPTISDPMAIIVTVEKKGPIFRKKPVVQLEGTVRNPIEARKAEETIQRKLPTVEIENHLSPA